MTKFPFFITLHMYHLNTQPTLLHFQCQNLMFENQLTLFLILNTSAATCKVLYICII